MITAEQKAWADRKVPPVTFLGMASIALIAAGVSYLAAYLPKHAPLAPAVGLLIAAAIVLATAAALVTRVPDFAWGRFFQVGAWTLLAYVVIAGMIEYAFLRNHLRGGPLVVLTLSLVVFAVHVPMLVGFTVARYHEPDPAAARS